MELLLKPHGDYHNTDKENGKPLCECANITFKTRAGRTYYVRPDGSDDNDGLSIATAWKTFKHALLVIKQV